MKITANRVSELKERRSQLRNDINRMSAEHDTQLNNYRDARKSAAKQLEKKVADLIGPTSLALAISANREYVNFSDDGDSITWFVKVSAHSNDMFAEGTSLTWHWSAQLDYEGKVLKDSGSYSGLKAVTAEQIDDLKESVRIIEILNNLDWTAILNTPAPERKDYVDEDLQIKLRDLKRENLDSNFELLDEVVKEAIKAGNVVVKIKPKGYILPTSIGESTITGHFYPYDVGLVDEDAESIKKNWPKKRMKRQDFALDDNDEPITRTLLSAPV